MKQSFLKDERGDAVIEATILFPIIIMIFAALVMLSMYLPQSSNLQRAVQYAAVIVANSQSDTGYTYNADTDTTSWSYTYEKGVYSQFFSHNRSGSADMSEDIVTRLMDEGFVERNSELEIDYNFENHIFYRVVEVNATETVTMPIALPFIGFSDKLVVRASARCTVHNGEELVRNIDIAVDAVAYLDDRFNISSTLFSAINTVKDFFGL